MKAKIFLSWALILGCPLAAVASPPEPQTKPVQIKVSAPEPELAPPGDSKDRQAPPIKNAAAVQSKDGAGEKDPLSLLGSIIQKNEAMAKKDILQRLTDVFWENRERPLFVSDELRNAKGTKDRTQEALSNVWKEDTLNATVLYYVLGPGKNPPAWLTNGLAKADEKTRQAILQADDRRAAFLDCMSRWSDPSGPSSCYPADQDAAIKDYQGLLKEVTDGHDKHLQAFLVDAGKEAGWVVESSRVSKKDIRTPIKETQQLTQGEPPPGASVTLTGGDGKKGKVDGGLSMSSDFIELHGQKGDPDVFVHTYEDDPDGAKFGESVLSVRLVSDWCGPEKNFVCDKLAINDISNADPATGEGRVTGDIFSVDEYNSEKSFSLDWKNPKARKWKLELVPTKGGDVMVMIKGDDGRPIMNPNTKLPATLSLSWLRQQRVRRTREIGRYVELDGLKFYVMPQAAGAKGCHQLLPESMVDGGAADDPRRGLGCVAPMVGSHPDYQQRVKALKLGDKEFVEVYNPQKGLYEIKEGPWPVDSKPGAPGEGAPGKPEPGGPGNDPNNPNPNPDDRPKDVCRAPAGPDVPVHKFQEKCIDAWLQVVVHPDGSGLHAWDLTKKWQMILVKDKRNATTRRGGSNKDDEDKQSFMLLVLNNKAIHFSGVMMCKDSTQCVEESAGKIRVRTSVAEDLEGKMIATLDMSQHQTDPKTGRTQYRGNDGGFYSVSGQELFEIPVGKDKGGIRSDEKLPPGQSMAALSLISASVAEEAQEGRPMIVNLYLKAEDYKGRIERGQDATDNTSVAGMQWQARMEDFYKRYASASNIFGSDQAQNREVLNEYVTEQIASDEHYARNEKWGDEEIKRWTPFMVVHLQQPGEQKGNKGRFRVAEYFDLSKDNHAQKYHKDCLFWGKKTPKDLGVFKDVCKP